MHIIDRKIKLCFFSILSGNDIIGKDNYKERVFDILSEKEQNVRVERYNSSDLSFIEYCENIITPSLFPETRIFLVNHAQNIKENELKFLAGIIKNVIDNVYVIIDFDGNFEKKVLHTNGIDKLLNDKSGNYQHIIFSVPTRDYQMADWLVEKVKVIYNRKIEKKTAEKFLDLVGYEDIGRIYSELQKIDIHLNEGSDITDDVVEHVCGAFRSIQPAELALHLANGNIIKSLEIVQKLYEEGVYPLQIISALFYHFWKIYRIRVYCEENREFANQYFRLKYMDKNRIAYKIAVACNIMREESNDTIGAKKAYGAIVIPGLIEQAKAISYKDFVEIFEILREYDIGIKSGQMKFELNDFNILCYRIIKRVTSSKKEHSIG